VGGLSQIALERVELTLPERPVIGDPFTHVLEAARLEREPVKPAVTAARNEPGPLEHAQVSRNGGQRDVERLGEPARRRGSLSQALEHGTTDRIGKRCEGGIERVLKLINHVVKHTATAGTGASEFERQADEAWNAAGPTRSPSSSRGGAVRGLDASLRH
jgi:hypothetical protein